MKKESYFLSSNKINNIHFIRWIPDSNIKATLQICHGMTEYIDRYDDFANFLNSKGILVVGHDHIGHGKSVLNQESLGYFGKDANKYLLKDINHVSKKISRDYPDLPHYILGHSMGSFLLRQYLHTFSEEAKNFEGVIIMGTGHKSRLELIAGITACSFLELIKGGHYRSEFINNLAFGGYNKSFSNTITKYDWLTKDPFIVNDYANNPLCNYTFTVNAYKHMLRGILTLTNNKNLKKIPKNLTIYFMSGDKDPVGNFKKGVKKVYNQYKKLNINEVLIRFYEDDRHEILNETDRIVVYNDIYYFMT